MLTILRTDSYPVQYAQPPSVTISYNSLDVLVQSQRLVYDLPSFLSALGGSLGLYLGMSCLGTLYAFVNVASVASKSLHGKRKAAGRQKVETA